MSDKVQTKILLVDDEESILKALRRLLADEDLKIFTATSGIEALEIFKANDITLMISDQRMPQMTGVELLQQCREISPDCIRILLTGYADINVTIDAINGGAIKYYFNKPWDDDLLLSRIRESIEFAQMSKERKQLQKQIAEQNEQLKNFNLKLKEKVDEQTKEIKEQHQELNQSFMETIKAFSTFIEMRNKEVGSHSQRVAMLVKNMLKSYELGPSEYQDIVVSAYLHDIGKISLPDKIIKKLPDDYSFAEIELVKKHPTIGQTVVYNISGFEEIGVIIRNHHESYDGSGYPDGLVENQIPLGSRIIRICDEFDHCAFKGGYPDLKTLNEASARLVQFAGSRFDPDIVKKFIDRDIAKTIYYQEGQDTTHIHADDLMEGMVVAGDIFTRNGMFLLPKGAKLSKGMISRIRKINTVDPIAGEIRVYKKAEEEKAEHVTI